jgi:hypothetical protein
MDTQIFEITLDDMKITEPNPKYVNENKRKELAVSLFRPALLRGLTLRSKVLFLMECDQIWCSATLFSFYFGGADELKSCIQSTLAWCSLSSYEQLFEDYRD